MELQNDFEVSADVDTVWDFLLDVEAVAPCMPGAELTEVVDDTTWKGRVKVKLGPVSLTYAGKVTLVERDDDAHRVVLKASGTEARGKGTAAATVTSTVEGTGSGARVSIVTDLTLSGAAAQYGRGMIGDVSKRLTDEFASCLEEQLGTPAAAPGVVGGDPAEDGTGDGAEDHGDDAAGGRAGRLAPPARPPAKQRSLPVGRIAAWTLWRALLRSLRRLMRAFGAAGDAFLRTLREPNGD